MADSQEMYCSELNSGLDRDEKMEISPDLFTPENEFISEEKESKQSQTHVQVDDGIDAAVDAVDAVAAVTDRT